MKVIIQAGGRGSRLRHHTRNKPKCLVSVNGKPIIFHLFEKFPEASEFIVIGDYRFDILKSYLENFTLPKKVTLIKANGEGTASGIKDACELLDEKESFIIVWSDIVFNKQFVAKKESGNVIYTTDSFKCRWSINEEKVISETPSLSTGIPGLFSFENKTVLADLPPSGEFVRWLSTNIKQYKVESISELEEFGDFHYLENKNSNTVFCRFFNHVQIDAEKIVKKVIDNNYEELHKDEINWYKEIKKYNYKNIPKIFSYQPLTLERVHGKHPFEVENLTKRESCILINNIFDSLDDLHSLGDMGVDKYAYLTIYKDKTIERIEKVKKLIPGIGNKSMVVNGLKCNNIYHDSNIADFISHVDGLVFDKICVFHGDPTFSNILIDKYFKPYLIDPRGRFVDSGIYGDPLYDYAKVYYSAIGGYDNFNRRNFQLYIDNSTVEIIAPELKFKEIVEELLLERFPKEINKIKLLHVLIWLSFTGYVTDDIDSMIAAYYNGLYWYERYLNDC